MRGLLTLSLVVLAGVVAVTEAAQCAYTTYTSCGFLWWWTCTRISYRYCEHGGWTAWAEHSRSACSKTCGGGTLNITRTRSCTNPSPYGGGRSCSGVSSMRVVSSCNTQPCPIDGGWTDWGDWEDTSKCTVMCGGGEKNQSRDRSCTNPQPQFGGRDCDGENTQNTTVTCNTQECVEVCVLRERTRSSPTPPTTTTTTTASRDRTTLCPPRPSSCNVPKALYGNRTSRLVPTDLLTPPPPPPPPPPAQRARAALTPTTARSTCNVLAAMRSDARVERAQSSTTRSVCATLPPLSPAEMPGCIHLIRSAVSRLKQVF